MDESIHMLPLIFKQFNHVSPRNGKVQINGATEENVTKETGTKMWARLKGALKDVRTSQRLQKQQAIPIQSYDVKRGKTA